MIATIVQASLHWQDREKNLAHLGALLDPVEQTDLIVLPEMFSTGFTMEPEKHAEDHEGRSFRWMQGMARQKSAVVAGSLSVRDKDKFYNRLYWVRPDGAYEYYDKRHLFRMGDEHNHYSAGTKRLISNIKGVKICPLVCYDLRFPVWSRNRFDKEAMAYDYDVLVYVANWPSVRAYAWKQLLVARAIENQCCVIGVNRVGKDGNGIPHSGGSVVIGPKGEMLREAGEDQECVVSCTLDLDEIAEFRKKFPAGADSDDFELRI